MPGVRAGAGRREPLEIVVLRLRWAGVQLCECRRSFLRQRVIDL
jgi:hypothetical protein